MGAGMASIVQSWSASRIRGPGLVGLLGPGPVVGGIPGPRPGGLGASRGEFLKPGIRAGGGLLDQSFWLGPGCPEPVLGWFRGV